MEQSSKIIKNLLTEANGLKLTAAPLASDPGRKKQVQDKLMACIRASKSLSAAINDAEPDQQDYAHNPQEFKVATYQWRDLRNSVESINEALRDFLRRSTIPAHLR